jgi:tetratricopeptide (TPR) repeat protein
VLRAKGELADSLEHHRAELALQEELVRREPETARWRQYLGVSNNRVGMLLEAQGQIPAAAEHFARALAINGELAASDPENVDWQRELGRSHYRAGLVDDARGDRHAARSHLQRAATILGLAAGRDPLNPARQRDLAEVRAALAQHYLAAGDATRAGDESRIARQIAEQLIGRSKDDRQAVRLLGLALVLQAQALEHSGRQRLATGVWAEAVAALEPIAGSARDYLVLDPWAQALAGAGRIGEAKEVVQTLAAIGYRNPAFITAISRRGIRMPPPAH